MAQHRLSLGKAFIFLDVKQLFSNKTLKNIESKKNSTRQVNADETRKLQEKAAKEYDEQEKKRLELAQEKLKTKTKKSDVGKKKMASKKKPLTTKKK